MKVYIKPKVDAFIKAFYEKAMTDHITLDEPTIAAKVFYKMKTNIISINFI